MSIGDNIKNLYLQTRWGDWSLICLYVSLVSGIIVGIHYDPAAPFYSTSAIDILVPYGEYFRSLHFYSSQFFFLFAVFHYCAVFPETESYDTKSHIFLILTLPVALVLLFTGYVLRSDSTGFSAGMIAEHILETIPLIGPTLNNMLFSISDNGLNRVYLHHIFSFDALFLLFAWDHLRRYKVNISNHLLLLGTVLFFSLLVTAPIDPEELGIFYITGPWFFLGLQELLRYLPPFIAGVLFPAVFIIALIILRKRYRWYKSILVGVVLWLGGYALLTVLALTAHS
jgi:hypothetical protein